MQHIFNVYILATKLSYLTCVITDSCIPKPHYRGNNGNITNHIITSKQGMHPVNFCLYFFRTYG